MLLWTTSRRWTTLTRQDLSTSTTNRKMFVSRNRRPAGRCTTSSSLALSHVISGTRPNQSWRLWRTDSVRRQTLKARRLRHLQMRRRKPTNIWPRSAEALASRTWLTLDWTHWVTAEATDEDRCPTLQWCVAMSNWRHRPGWRHGLMRYGNASNLR